MHDCRREEEEEEVEEEEDEVKITEEEMANAEVINLSEYREAQQVEFFWHWSETLRILDSAMRVEIRRRAMKNLRGYQPRPLLPMHSLETVQDYHEIMFRHKELNAQFYRPCGGAYKYVSKSVEQSIYGLSQEVNRLVSLAPFPMDHGAPAELPYIELALRVFRRDLLL